jgi:cytochrome c6
MRKHFVAAAVVVILQPGIIAAATDGKTDFDLFCSGCHPKGGNPINPAKTLRKFDREANGIRKAADIVRIMRNPGQGMRSYTKKEIPDDRARAIADYILKTF